MEFNIVEKLLSLTLLGTEWILWLLVFLSVLSVAIILERILFFIRMKIDFAQFSDRLTEQLIQHNIPEARKVCETNHSLESDMALKGFDYQEKGVKAMEEGMTSYINGQRTKLDRGLVVLGTLGNNAPFIGLFGTVLGIIQAFNDLAENPAGGPSVVMAGISEALVATAVGLMVAIPAVIAYNAFQRVIRTKLSNSEAVKNLIVAHFSRQS